MLSLTSGKPIASLGKNEIIYIKEAPEDAESELDTTQANKIKIFKSYLKSDKKLTETEINTLLKAYQNNQTIEGKLSRKFSNALQHTEDSVKYFLNFGEASDVFPIIKDKSYRIFVSGLSGSGKSFFITEFLKHNRKKNQHVFLFSPIKNDESLKGISDLQHIDLEVVEAEIRGIFDIEMVPEGSVVIFDDIESSPDAKKLMKIRDMFLERGRHLNISTITVSHNPLGSHKTKASIREAQYFVLFPRFNKRDTTALLKTYAGYNNNMIDEIFQTKSRWLFVCKTIPSYWVSSDAVKLH